MNLTAEEKQFIRDHASDDANRLLLGAKKYPQLDVPFLVDQILSADSGEIAFVVCQRRLGFSRQDCR